MRASKLLQELQIFIDKEAEAVAIEITESFSTESAFLKGVLQGLNTISDKITELERQK